MSVRFVIALVATSTLFAAAGGEVTKEIALLKGAWLVTGGEADGRAVPEEEVKKKVIVTFAAHKLSMTEAGMKDQVQLSYKLDPTQTPKAIDITPETASRGIIRGIYQLNGDRLKICLGEPGKERPKKFETKPGSGHKLMELRRTKP